MAVIQGRKKGKKAPSGIYSDFQDLSEESPKQLGLIPELLLQRTPESSSPHLRDSTKKEA